MSYPHMVKCYQSTSMVYMYDSSNYYNYLAYQISQNKYETVNVRHQ